ncbi:ASCH domain-containing protein [Adlercreutzia sp. ZJ304]|uniref:ASCH domain-containing protein n=1 Tax=Adlercreutzia sp. ZJ304 TaxID=2709791 RepID=UPI00197FDD0C|nr:ASCH domain-containing protein [Adlercreutzia sp. ZJ304]
MEVDVCTILLSIKPKYVDRILEESKKYEYRKRVAKRPVEKIVIYATYPKKRVVAEVQVEKIICDSPERLWERTKELSGIDQEDYFEYFAGNATAYAYELGELSVFEESLPLSSIGITVAPQSFCYVDGGELIGNN